MEAPGGRQQSRRHANTALALALGFLLPNVRDQRLATLREPHRPMLSRVRCIALFALLFFYVVSGRVSCPTHGQFLGQISLRSYTFQEQSVFVSFDLDRCPQGFHLVQGSPISLVIYVRQFR